MDFLQKPLAWFSSFYIGVQSKICGRKSFFFHSSFLNFSGFWAKIFSDFWPKNFKKLSNLLSACCVSRGTVCGLNFFFQSFESFWIFCRNLWHGSQKSIYVSRVKIAGKNSFFLFSFQNFFDFWAKIFQTFSQKTSRKCKNYLLRVHRNNLWLYNFLKSFEPFWIFYRNLWHGSQNSIYVSRVKSAGKNSCFLFPFQTFFDFWAKFSQTFGKKTSRKCENYFCVSTSTTCGLIGF